MVHTFKEVINNFVLNIDDKVGRVTSKTQNGVRCLYNGDILLACNIEGFIFDNTWATSNKSVEYREYLDSRVERVLLFEIADLKADRELLLKVAIEGALIRLENDKVLVNYSVSGWVRKNAEERIQKNSSFLEKFNIGDSK